MGEQSQDQRRIRELDDEWSDAANTGDIDAILEFYAEDGSVVWPDAPAGHGHEGIRKALKAMFDYCINLKLHFYPERIEVAKSGDMATDYGAVNFKYDTTDGIHHDDTSKYVVVWRRTNGDWKVLYDCYNSNAPAPVPPPLQSRPATKKAATKKAATKKAATKKVATKKAVGKKAVKKVAKRKGVKKTVKKTVKKAAKKK